MYYLSDITRLRLVGEGRPSLLCSMNEEHPNPVSSIRLITRGPSATNRMSRMGGTVRAALLYFSKVLQYSELNYSAGFCSVARGRHRRGGAGT